MEGTPVYQPKGTVTPLAKAFSPEEAAKAVRKVEAALAEPEKELAKLQEYVEDNHDLIKLVQKLPDEVSYNIMVPFGKAAFFPGRMIHTNEFLVLLGEGFYAERTAKQTLDILRRRSKMLDSKVAGIKATMDDLRAEASFFASTASDAAEGMMEIREEYVDTPSVSKQEELDKNKSIDTEKEVDGTQEDDKEFERLMSRLDELEKEEAEAEREGHDSGYEYSEDATSDYENDSDTDKEINVQENIVSGQRKETQEAMETYRETVACDSNMIPSKNDKLIISSPADIPKFVETKTLACNEGQDIGKAESSHGKAIMNTASNVLVSKDSPKVQEKEGEYESRKAFTGLVLERNTNELSGSEGSHAAQVKDKKSRPVSRFKMQKSGNKL